MDISAVTAIFGRSKCTLPRPRRDDSVDVRILSWRRSVLVQALSREHDKTEECRPCPTLHHTTPPYMHMPSSRVILYTPDLTFVFYPHRTSRVSAA